MQSPSWPPSLLLLGVSWSLLISARICTPQPSSLPISLQEVPFSRVWCSNRQPLHCAFSLERYTPTTTQLSCKICIRQLKGHEQILQVQTSILEVSPWSTGHLTPFLKGNKNNIPITTAQKSFKMHSFFSSSFMIEQIILFGLSILWQLYILKTDSHRLTLTVIHQIFESSSLRRENKLFLRL